MMKERLKYYLRGLGTGIVVTMILMMVSNANAAQGTADNKVSDEIEEQTSEVYSKESLWGDRVPVIERESETEDPIVEDAYIEESLIQEETKQDAEVTESVQEYERVSEEDAAVVKTETSTVEESSLAVEESSSVSEVEIQASQDDVGQNTVDETVTIQVVKGDGSGTVARKLQNAGLIDNASEFDAYLMQHGYDKKIRIGTVKIEAGATWMEIADKLSGK